LAGRIHLDFHSDDSIVQQIVRQIEELVTEGTFQPGDQLPTVRELAIDLRINFSTVARAYRMLDEKRLISTQRGRGTYIEEPGPPLGEEDEEDHITSSEELAALAQAFIRQAAQSGASLEQIEQAVRQQLKDWQQAHPTSSGNHLGG
jgi:GntR family transcriptional regulator